MSENRLRGIDDLSEREKSDLVSTINNFIDTLDTDMLYIIVKYIKKEIKIRKHVGILNDYINTIDLKIHKMYMNKIEKELHIIKIEKEKRYELKSEITQELI